jgi:hypothetical protein
MKTTVMFVFLLTLWVESVRPQASTKYSPSYPKPTIEVYMRDGNVVVCNDCFLKDAVADKGVWVILPGAGENTPMDPRQFLYFEAYSVDEQDASSHIRGDLYMTNNRIIKNIQIRAHHLSGMIFGTETTYWLANKVVKNVKKIVYTYPVE